MIGAGTVCNGEGRRLRQQRCGRRFKLRHAAVLRDLGICQGHMAQTAIDAVLGMVVQRRRLDHLHASQHEQHQGDESVTLGELQ